MSARAPDGEGSGGEPRPPSFEALLAEIERLTTLLERGEVPLEQALAAFETGMAKVREAGLVLDQAEARLARLVEGPRGELREIPMALPGEGQPAAPRRP